MSRAISLVFSLAIAVVIAGGLSMPADARPDPGQPGTIAQRPSANSTGPGSGQQPQADSSGIEPRSAQGPTSRQPSGIAGPQGTSRAPAAAPSGRADSRPTGAKTRANQPVPARTGEPRGEQPPRTRSVQRPGGPDDNAAAPVSPDRPRAQEPAPVEAPGRTTPVHPPTSPPVVDNHPVGTPAPTPAPVGPAAPPATDDPLTTDTAGPAPGTPTGPTVSGPPNPAVDSPASPAVRLSVVGAWFADRIHGLMASPPALPRPQLAPIQPPTAPTAFGLLFGLLGAWYILQRVAWNRLGHVPLTSPPGPGWDVAHG